MQNPPPEGLLPENPPSPQEKAIAPARYGQDLGAWRAAALKLEAEIYSSAGSGCAGVHTALRFL